MTGIKEQKVIEFYEQQICQAPIEEVYEWISRVDDYKSWMPHCTDSGIDKVLNEQCHHAYLTVDVSLFKNTLITCNTYTPNAQVNMSLVKGPFKTFEGRWRLERVSDETTLATLTVQAQLKQSFLEPLAQLLMSQYRGKIISLLNKRFFNESTDRLK